jgi:uncharacterized membrane protein
MATINTTDPKPGYVYNQDDDTWYPLLGLATQALDELTDVVITSPTTSQILVYNGTNWVNGGETGDISAVTSGTGITVTNGTGPIPSIAIDTSVTADLTTAQTLALKTLSSPVLVAGEERMVFTGTAATGTINIDLLTANTHFYNVNATGNTTINLRGSSSTSLNTIVATNDTITAVVLIQNGSTAYYPTAFQIDGASVTPKWQGGTAPSSGNASSIDAYVFTIMKSGSATYTVLASQTKFA